LDFGGGFLGAVLFLADLLADFFAAAFRGAVFFFEALLFAAGFFFGEVFPPALFVIFAFDFFWVVFFLARFFRAAIRGV
jgi:hypothetical protein